MIHIALLAATLALTGIEAPPPTARAADSATSKTPVQQCFESMDGAVYHGDPSDRSLMKNNVAACERGLALIGRMRPSTAQGPEKLFITARILDRAAILSFIGLNDAPTALREVKLANLYFRVASGLTGQAPNFRSAALANVELTGVQLKTLRTEIVAERASHQTLALRAANAAHLHAARTPRVNAPVYTAYHKN